MKRLMIFRNIDGGGGNGAGEVRTDASAPAPAFSWTSPEGALSAGWTDRLPEELRGNASLKTVTSLPDLAKSYVETKRLIGAKMGVPGEQATPEQIAAWRRTVGAPDRVEGYQTEGKSLRPESIPEGLWDANNERKFLEIAHKHHLPAAAVNEILGFYGQSIADGMASSQEQQATSLQEEGGKLRQAWGSDFDANLGLAARVARTVGLDPQTHPIFTSAEVVQAFARFGRLLSEDKLVKGDVSGISGSINDRVQSITDPGSTTTLAREYRGEFGPERQQSAQQQLHQLMHAYSSNG